MADIDEVDNHMGRVRDTGTVNGMTASGMYVATAEEAAVSSGVVARRHSFEGKTLTTSCLQCGMLRIHDNHRGYDYDTEANTPGVKPETIAEEASRIVYGDREQAYDDPNQNFRRIAHMWTGTLDKKLAPGCEITPRDVALMLIQLKISREAFTPNRDNRVDVIGYALCLDRIVQAEAKTDASS